MSVNILPFSLDRALSDVGGALQLLHHLPDQPGSVFVCRFVAYGSANFQSIFSSLKSGNEVSLTLIINDGTLERLD